MKVCKFGGTSMADAEAMRRVAAIIESDLERGFVVVSAPGKRFAKDEKITDLLYKAHSEYNSGAAESTALGMVRDRFCQIVSDLGIDLDIDMYFDKIALDLKAGANSDYAASRGEFLSAIVMAKLLGYEFLDAVHIIKFFDDGSFDAEYTNDLCRHALEEKTNVVIPGFYGMIEGKNIKTFSRGGSDITGAIIARAISASVYENWTDVDGVLICDPRIIPDSMLINVLTYKELRELSYMGAGVLHHDAIFPVRKSSIPINIKNTFAPDKPGTMIIPTDLRRPAQRTITGIAGRKGFVAIHIEKSMMNNEVGFLRKALTVLEHHDISVEHVPTGIDTLSFIIDERELEGIIMDELVNELSMMLHTDNITIVKDLSMIATVGHGMSKKKGTAARLFSALSTANINIKMIDQGSSELNIIVCVDSKDFEDAIRAIYKAFVR